MRIRKIENENHHNLIKLNKNKMILFFVLSQLHQDTISNQSLTLHSDSSFALN
jgi:hypothetical protein